MSKKVALVPSGRLSMVLPGLVPLLHKSEAWSRGRANVDDIMRFVFNGEMQLWAVFESDDMTLHGYVITEMKQYPQCKMLVCQYCAGDIGVMKEVEDDMHNILANYARDAGCAGIEFFGRPGWSAHAKRYGYDVRTVVYEKYFNGDTP